MIKVAGKDPNKVNHILQKKHAWSKIDANPNWKKVSKHILYVLNKGVKIKYKTQEGVYRRTAIVKGFKVNVIFFESSSGKCKLTDAWVNTKS